MTEGGKGARQQGKGRKGAAVWVKESGWGLWLGLGGTVLYEGGQLGFGPALVFLTAVPIANLPESSWALGRP